MAILTAIVIFFKAIVAVLNVIGNPFANQCLRFGWWNKIGRRRWLDDGQKVASLIRLFLDQNPFNRFTEFLKRERFVEQGVYPSRCLAKYFIILHKSRNHDNRLSWNHLSNAGYQLIPLHSWHRKISYHQIEPAFCHLTQCSFAAVSLPNLVSVMLQQHGNGLANNRLIVNNQNLNSLFHE